MLRHRARAVLAGVGFGQSVFDNAFVVSHNYARTHPAPSSSTTRMLRAWQAAPRLELFRWCWAASGKLSQGANSKASCRTAWTCDDHILNMPR